MILRKSMTFILHLLFLITPISVSAGIEESGIYRAYNIQDVKYLASKYTPTFVPCKYGVEMAFDQAHFVPLPNLPFTKQRVCPTGCETMTVTLPNSTHQATVCCLPETPWKHLKTVSIQGGHGIRKVDELMTKLQVTHWLSLVFPEIVPRRKRNATSSAPGSNQQKSEPENHSRFTITMFGYLILGAAFAQMIVAAVAGFTMYISRGRIELDAPPDCDYIIKPIVKLHNPSKSGMMSENMNSDLMSMSQGAL